MGSSWQPVRLGDVVERITVGHVGPMASEYVGTGVPFLRSQNVTAAGISDKDLKFISAEFDARLVKSSLREGDVVVVRTGRPGTAAVVPSQYHGANCSDLVVIRTGQRVDPRFLSGFINSVAQGQIAANIVGAVQQHFNVGAARNLQLRLPAISEQRKIASVLNALDGKITSNLDLIANQRSLRSLCFHAVAARVPRGPLATIARIVGNSIQPMREPDERFQQFSIPAFDENEHPDICFGRDMASGKTLLPPGPILLFSKLNPVTPRVWEPVRGDEGPAVCSPEFVALEANSDAPHSWIEATLRSDGVFYEEIMSRVTGSTGSRQRIKPKDLLEASAPLGQGDEYSKWAAFADPLLAREAALFREVSTLTALRSALLPKLVSGGIRVTESDDLAETLGPAADRLEAEAAA